MPEANKTNSKNKVEELIEISFLGFKLKCSNPTSKAIIILIVSFVFLIVLLLVLPHNSILKWVSK